MELFLSIIWLPAVLILSGLGGSPFLTFSSINTLQDSYFSKVAWSQVSHSTSEINSVHCDKQWHLLDLTSRHPSLLVSLLSNWRWNFIFFKMLFSYTQGLSQPSASPRNLYWVTSIPLSQGLMAQGLPSASWTLLSQQWLLSIHEQNVECRCNALPLTTARLGYSQKTHANFEKDLFYTKAWVMQQL